MSFLICHYVILSYKNHQFLPVTLLFCLQKNICLSLSLCHYVLKKTSVSLRHSVILSSKNICLSLSLFHYVFKKNICLPLSLCHYVFKKASVSLRPSVILSSKKHLSPFVIMSLCLQKISVSLSVPLLFCLKTPQLVTEAGPAVVDVISFLSVLYQYFISCATSSPTTFLQYILFDKVVEVTCCGIL